MNKVNTRLTLHFDVEASPSLDPAEKQRLRRRLPTRITRDGILQLHCQRERSQSANRRELIRRFDALIEEALKPPRIRRASRVPRAERERRLRQKKRLGELKRTRRSGADDEG